MKGRRGRRGTDGPIRFCGDEMGEAIPPMLDARAIPRMRDLEKADLEGSVRKMGCGWIDPFNQGTTSACTHHAKQGGKAVTHLN